MFSSGGPLINKDCGTHTNFLKLANCINQAKESLTNNCHNFILLYVEHDINLIVSFSNVEVESEFLKYHQSPTNIIRHPPFSHFLLMIIYQTNYQIFIGHGISFLG